jgi:hypothetical protein
MAVPAQKTSRNPATSAARNAPKHWNIDLRFMVSSWSSG